ncbi:Intraflagellar transport protein 22 [Pleodorina starrii]|uniref:Intraflagellar transport protein 22 n=1 Tax=Pleodorina starrii TaxID=330485 RepID=A0A9W6F8H1_9CHLO|nr:Intraflagellar transport protein 22 [Pleodorina starrii]
MAETTLKLAVVGPCRTGKTLLCRALAEQPILLGEMAYQPTAAVRSAGRACRALHACPPTEGHVAKRIMERLNGRRIQEISRVLGIDRVKVQFWDCSGSVQYQSYWPVLAKELDGLLLVIDPARPEQERELETFYRNFAEPNNLYTRQCMVMAVQVQKEGGGIGGWQGMGLQNGGSNRGHQDTCLMPTG